MFAKPFQPFSTDGVMEDGGNSSFEEEGRIDIA